MSNLTSVSRISDSSGIGEARRTAIGIASEAGFSETEAGSLAIAVTEAASNVLKHASGGEILLRRTGPGVEMLAIDKGPGIANLDEALRDGRSSAGTAGIGLGAISRLSTRLEVYTGAERGTVLRAEFQPGDALHRLGTPPFLELGAVNAPYPGEVVSGDAWAAADARLLVADGLGHGSQAAAAAHLAVETFTRYPDRPLHAVVEATHLALRSTRGAAVALAEIDPAAKLARFCGLGNITGAVINGRERQGMVSHNGTAGHEVGRIAQFQYEFPDRALLVMHSDGISAKWDLEAYPGLLHHHPSLIAGVLYRDFQRQRDDATVVVARLRPAETNGGRQ